MAVGDAPRVTVFVPVHDRAHVLRESLETVLAQSFSDFELLVVDDGSSDASVEIASSIGDPRVRVVVQDRNRGIPATRNHGLDLARGELLAMVDSDDHVHPDRLAHQVAFLDAHPRIAAVGSWALRMDESGRPSGGPLLRPTDPREIRGRILFVSCFKNPTMTARTRILREFRYREQFTIASDIDIWARISREHELANLPRFLIRYRAGGVSHRSDALRFEMRCRIARDMLQELELPFDERDVEGHVQLRNLSGYRPDRAFLEWSEDWLHRLVRANVRTRRFPEPEFTRAAAERWLLIGLRALRAGHLRVPTGSLGRRATALFGGIGGYARLGLGLLEGWGRGLPRLAR
jgi:glycosyltransferase involved in cell wall biosynthesis